MVVTNFAITAKNCFWRILSCCDFGKKKFGMKMWLVKCEEKFQESCNSMQQKILSLLFDTIDIKLLIWQTRIFSHLTCLTFKRKIFAFPMHSSMIWSSCLHKCWQLAELLCLPKLSLRCAKNEAQMLQNPTPILLCTEASSFSISTLWMDHCVIVFMLLLACCNGRCCQWCWTVITMTHCVIFAVGHRHRCHLCLCTALCMLFVLHSFNEWNTLSLSCQTIHQFVLADDQAPSVVCQVLGQIDQQCEPQLFHLVSLQSQSRGISPQSSPPQWIFNIGGSVHRVLRVLVQKWGEWWEKFERHLPWQWGIKSLLSTLMIWNIGRSCTNPTHEKTIMKFLSLRSASLDVSFYTPCPVLFLQPRSKMIKSETA